MEERVKNLLFQRWLIVISCSKTNYWTDQYNVSILYTKKEEKSCGPKKIDIYFDGLHIHSAFYLLCWRF